MNGGWGLAYAQCSVWNDRPMGTRCIAQWNLPNNLCGKRFWKKKKDMCTGITESLFCIAEIIIALWINYALIKKKNKKPKPPSQRSWDKQVDSTCGRGQVIFCRYLWLKVLAKSHRASRSHSHGQGPWSWGDTLSINLDSATSSLRDFKQVL